MPSPAHDGRGQSTRTTLHVDNLHCESCVISIAEIIEHVPLFDTQEDLDGKGPIISDVAISLPEQTVSFTHPKDFDPKVVLNHLDASGFDVRPQSNVMTVLAPDISRWRSILPSFGRRTTKGSKGEVDHREVCIASEMTGKADDRLSSNIKNVPESRSTTEASCREENHRKICLVCHAPGSTSRGIDAKLGNTEKLISRETHLRKEAVAHASAVASHVSSPLKPEDRSPKVAARFPSTLTNQGAKVMAMDNVPKIIKETAYDAQLIMSNRSSKGDTSPQRVPATYTAVFSISGMSCTSCVAAITRTLENMPGMTSISVDLLGNAGSVVIQHREDAELARREIEDAGFECSLVDVLENEIIKDVSKVHSRSVTLEVGGMSDKNCVDNVNAALATLSQRHGLTFGLVTLDHPTSTVTYIPHAPTFTLRSIRDEITSLGFKVSVVHVDSVEEHAARARLREQRDLLLRFAATLVFAIPTFIVAVVGMSLVGKNNAFRKSLQAPAWGNASRATIILFVLATPVQFGIGWFFYDHAWKNLKGVWRKPILQVSRWRIWTTRLFRWGSMDTLAALGTSTGYFASLVLMILDITAKPMQGNMGGAMGWFDSSVFFIFFILAGRYLESVSKQRTGDAIAALSATKPSTGLLYSPAASSTFAEQVDFLDIGDTLLVPAGESPPLDAVLASSSPSTSFNESSLTGEARPVLKNPGDQVFAGTINAGPAAAVVTVTKEVGETMLDGIVGVVRDAMGKKDGIERIADTVTGYFVPGVVGIALLTFGVWCLRGYLGELPADWANDPRRGGWVLFAVQFGVGVLIVTCPCGIGLAAPTAQMVGIGLAAQHGILSNGGGEAFQIISSMNTVVLDKTGTLTTSKFTVSDYKMFIEGSFHEIAFAMLLAAEQASTHPLAVGVREWCQTQLLKASKPPVNVQLVSSQETPGRGLLAVLIVSGHKVEVAIGNQNLMNDIAAEYRKDRGQTEPGIFTWQTEGKSVVFLSARLLTEPSSAVLYLPITSERHCILGVFGVYDPPRKEAQAVIAELRRLQMDVWMISGDNMVTAQSIAESVGIDKSHVIAGALPTDKQAWVKQLQSGEGRSAGTRAVVAFCGDGVNDAPAIAQADIGLAMGGGSNVAISTADFCLLSSNLLSILTVYHLARATRRKIISNFVWACLYNVALMPLAAGAFYFYGKTTLPPVWASAAMAMSSVSVVVNSLFLGWTYTPPNVVRKWNIANAV